MKHTAANAALAALLVTSCSGGGGSGGGEAPVYRNRPPTVQVNASVTIEEHGIFVASVEATDQDDGVQSVTAEGPDGAFFDVTRDRELVTLLDLDFEAPADSDGDNVYLVDVVARDNENLTTVRVEVTVSDMPHDGTVGLIGITSVTPGADWSGDGIADLVGVSADTPYDPVTDRYDYAYFLDRAKLASEQSRLLTRDQATEENALFRVTSMRGRVEPPWELAKYQGVGRAADGGRSVPYAIFESHENGEMRTNAVRGELFSLLGTSENDFILEEDSVLPVGWRSTREQEEDRFRSFRSLGDLDGDGFTEGASVADLPFDSDIAIEFKVADGHRVFETPDGAFAGVDPAGSDTRTFRINETLLRFEGFVGSFGRAKILDPDGSRDFNGDGVDEILLELRASHVIILAIDGAYVMGRSYGSVTEFSDIPAAKMTKLWLHHGIDASRIATGDADGDGHDDILISGFKRRSIDHDAYAVSGRHWFESGEMSLLNPPAGAVIGILNGGGEEADFTVRADLVETPIGSQRADLVVTGHWIETGMAVPRLYAAAVIVSDTAFDDGFPEEIVVADTYQPTPEGLETFELPHVLILSAGFDYYRYRDDGPGQYLARATFVEAIETEDLDGDGSPDLMVDESFLPAVEGFNGESRLWFIPSRRITQALTQGNTIDLTREFPAIRDD